MEPSPWPFLTSLTLLNFVLSLVGWFYTLTFNVIFLGMTFTALILCLYQWFGNIILEGTIEGHHTKKVQTGIRMGMILFITSEVMFFFAFFWAFFHVSISPSIAIGGIWPPFGLTVLNPWHIPLLNTLMPLSSGISVTWAHRAILANNRNAVIKGLIITILLGILFTEFQAFEYLTATFAINDGVYGSTFYLLTGFHGFHVIIGSIFLSVCLIRAIKYHFLRLHHIGLEASIWYWHFVDIVWIFLYLMLYIWGGR